MLSGAIEIRWGDQLEQTVADGRGRATCSTSRRARRTRSANLSDAEPAEYVVARDSPTEDSVEVPWAGYRPTRQ